MKITMHEYTEMRKATLFLMQQLVTVGTCPGAAGLRVQKAACDAVSVAAKRIAALPVPYKEECE